MEKQHLVFVYGSLKRNESNHGWIRYSHFVKEAETSKEYLLFDLGPYPCMVKATHGRGKSIKGELYNVTGECLRSLDVLEGISDGLYERVRIKVLGVKEEVWGYLFCHDVSQFPEAGNSWSGRR